MATPAAQTRLTPEQYIAFERKAPPDSKIIRHKSINGELIAMSGVSRAHNLITGNIFGELRTLLRGSRCETYAKRSKELYLSLEKTGFSPISKILRKVCHSPPSNANCLCGKSMNASHFLISVLENHKYNSEENKNTNRCHKIMNEHNTITFVEIKIHYK